MNIQTDFIGNMVAEDFRTAAIFKRHGIDFCCKGGRTIEEACNNKKLDPEKIYEELEALPENEVLPLTSTAGHWIFWQIISRKHTIVMWKKKPLFYRHSLISYAKFTVTGIPNYLRSTPYLMNLPMIWPLI
jgi:hypothetical protein